MIISPHSAPNNGNFYPRSPCGERRKVQKNNKTAKEFLSTLSLRRATIKLQILSYTRFNFYPRSPCGERLIDQCVMHGILSISIHALLAESDGCTRPNMWGDTVFLSTLSLRRATGSYSSVAHNMKISIHALLAESDLFICKKFIDYVDFYPRSPCGERLLWSTPAF